MSYYINVNMQRIKQNRKHNQNEPVVRYQKGKYGKPTYCHRLKFAEGEVIYSPHKPILPCGARLVIVTKEEPEVLE